MKKSSLLLIPFLLLTIIRLDAQVLSPSNAALNNIATIQSTDGWLKFKTEAAIDPTKVFTLNKAAFGLGTADDMLLYRTETDAQGKMHYRYQQTYNGIPVLGADMIVHAEQGKAVSANGKLVSKLQLSTNPTVSASAAIQQAIAFVGAQKYMWEDQANEDLLKRITGKTDASYYPQAQLVIMDKTYSGIPAKYRLLWKVNVYAAAPLSYQDIFIDAQTGAVVHLANRLRTDDVNGTAVTKYSGTQNIVTDSVAPGNYRLREIDRSGVETYNMLTGTDYGVAVDFTDTDNHWNNVNAQHDEVATDAHWGAEMTYDYYFIKHARNSYDNLGSKLVSYVHYDVDYANAFWDGTRMTYGDGDASNGPLTSLDVCGHEITHGVTEYSANMIYQDEPGALNESFSDMFGTAIEFYALNGAGDWLIGEDFDLTGDGFRNMSNPNADQQPDTYLGTYWYTGALDQGGVHTNSGVANYWFYLLSVGGSGTNDNGHYFSVDGVGIDTAAQIAYLALTQYMTSTSQYSDCRLATMQAAADIFGLCSDVYIQCANAWYAVGVGMAIADYDFSVLDITSPVTACGLTTVPVSVRAIYNGCNVDVPAGDTLHFSYSMDGAAAVNENYILPTLVQAGDTVSFTFTTQANVALIGMHTLDVSFVYAHDTLAYNNEITGYSFENKLYQNIDVGVTKITAPVSSCNLSANEDVSAEFEFFGCDYLPAGEVVKLAYSINGGALVYDSIQLAADLYPGVAQPFTFSVPADLFASGTYSVVVRTAFNLDTIMTNDAFTGYTVKKPLVLKDTIVTFEEANVSNFYLVHTTGFSHANLSLNADNNSTFGFLMTGGNPMSYFNLIEFPNGSNTWQINAFLSAKIDFCVDATAWSTANVAFDLKQTFGEQAYNAYVGPGDYSVASNLRVLVNDTVQIGGTYNPTTGNADPFISRFANLSAFAGTFFTLSFETRNLSKDTIIFTMDNAYLDNIRISEVSQIGMDETQPTEESVLYPNPNDGRFWIDFAAETNAPLTLEVLDYTGRLVYSSITDVLKGENKLRVDLGTQADGIYVVRLICGENTKTMRIVVQ